MLGFKEITAATNVRTMIAAAFPSIGSGNKVPVLVPTTPRCDEWLLLANLNAIIFSYAARQKIQGQTLNLFIVEQLPVVPPAGYERRFGNRTTAEIVRESVLELSYTAYGLAPFARDLGYVDIESHARRPFARDEDRRLRLRARLDALYFILYSVTDRDDVRYVFSTFPIVEREQVARWGRYRHRDLTLAWINALLAGQPDAAIDG